MVTKYDYSNIKGYLENITKNRKAMLLTSAAENEDPSYTYSLMIMKICINI